MDSIIQEGMETYPHPSQVLHQNEWYSKEMLFMMKVWQRYNRMKMVNVAEQIAEQNGKILVPSSCMTWSRKKGRNYVRIGKETFYLLSENEMTEREKEKRNDYIEGEKF